jgi:hypothetical protein
MFRVFLFTVLACLFAPVLCAQSQNPAPANEINDTKPESHAEQTQIDNKRPGDSNPSAITSLPEVSNPIPNKNQNKQSKNDQPANETNPIFGFFVNNWQTVFMMLFTGIVALFTAKLYSVNRRLMHISEKTLTMAQRAYLVIDKFSTDVEFYDAFLHKKPMMIYCRVINVGRTPGRIRSIYGKAEILENLPDRLDYPDGVPTEQMIGVGAEYESQFRAGVIETITDEQYTPLSKGEHVIFIWGRIIYIDIFDNEHTTCFATVHMPRTGEFYVPRDVIGLNSWT